MPNFNQSEKIGKAATIPKMSKELILKGFGAS